MTPEEVRALSDAELDALVAVEVMGWRLVSRGQIASWWSCRGQCGLTTRHEHRIRMDDEEGGFTTDGNAMLALIERMGTRGYATRVSSEPDEQPSCWIDGPTSAHAYATTIQRAVAEAAVLAVMKEERA